ncbi:hypothetical protein ABM016_13390 [Morganella morganii]|uniref:hypothetical protein n=1 Tax=Morganella morganii TaxID=582 RepID=UPI003EBF85D1
MKIKVFLFCILTSIFINPAYSNERAEDKTKCRLSIKGYIQTGSYYKITLFIYDEKNDYEYLFGKHAGFLLPLNSHSYNYIKTAYILNKKLCVQYYKKNNEYIITKMFDDYLINN